MPAKRSTPLPPVSVQCERCGVTFKRHQSEMRKRPAGRIFCSLACRDNVSPSPVEICEDGLTAWVSLLASDGTVIGHALIDATDAEWIGQWAWRLSNQGYAVRSERVSGKFTRIHMHRALLRLSEGDGFEGDHQDRDRLNNRRGNLRSLLEGKNGQNVPSYKNSTSAYRGVSWHPGSGKWMARVKVNKEQHFLGYFTDELEAAETARQARARLLPYATD